MSVDILTYPKSSLVEDVTILIPDLEFDEEYKDEQALYVQYDALHYTSNPLDDLYSLFKGQIAKNFSNMGPDFRQYWRQKLKKYPIIRTTILSDGDVPQFQELSDSIGTLFFSYLDETNSSIEDIDDYVVFSYNPSLYNKLFAIDGNVPNPLYKGLDAVNNLFLENSINLTEMASTKDVVSGYSNDDVQEVLYDFYYTQYGDLLTLLPIALQYSGSVLVAKNIYTMDIEDKVAKVDALLNEILPKIRWKQQSLLNT
jgi:hypothetical protein